MSKDLSQMGAIIGQLMPYGITISTGFDNVMGFEIRATKSFSVTPVDYMNLLVDPKTFEERIRKELGMYHNPKRIIHRVTHINSDYWVSSPRTRRR